jgi:hypothetical protein
VPTPTNWVQKPRPAKVTRHRAVTVRSKRIGQPPQSECLGLQNHRAEALREFQTVVA